MKKSINKTRESLLKKLAGLSFTTVLDASLPSNKSNKDIAPPSPAIAKGNKGNKASSNQEEEEEEEEKEPSKAERKLHSLLGKYTGTNRQEGSEEEDMAGPEQVVEGNVVKSKTIAGRISDLTGKPEKEGCRMQPHIPTKHTPNTHSEPASKTSEIQDIFENMPADKLLLQRAVNSYLDKLQYLALARAEKVLSSGVSDIPASELVKLASQLKDLQLTAKWTRKLEEAILDNPSKMLPPGSGKNFSLLGRLKLLGSSVMQEQKKDGRESVVKRSRNIMDVPMPADDSTESNKKAVGA